MQIAPLFPVAAGLVIGITLDPILLWSPWIYAAIVLIVSALSAIGRARRAAGPMIMLIAAIAVGAMLHFNSARSTSHSSVERFATEIGTIVRLRGTVASPPQLRTPKPSPLIPRAFQTDRTSFLLAVDAIEGVEGFARAGGLVRVTVREAVLDLVENERVEVFGRLWTLRPPVNPGSFDWSAHHRRQGIVAGLTCKHRENVSRLDVVPPGAVAPLIPRLRSRVRGYLIDDLATSGEERGGLLEAMVLGHRSKLDRRLNEIFIQAGCVHFLAVSGVHLVIVMFLTRIVCVPFALRSRSRTWVMLLAVVVYVLIAEPRPSILRAGVIAVIYCVGKLLGRERARLNWISATAITLALIDPLMVFDLGYQLSSAAVLGVVFLAPALRQIGRKGAHAAGHLIRRLLGIGLWSDVTDDDPIVRPLRAHRRSHWSAFLPKYFVTAFFISLAASLASLPIVATYFHRAHPWSPLSAIIVMPLVTLVMALGFVKVIAGLAFPSLGSWLAAPLLFVESKLTGLVEWLAQWPGASATLPPPPWWLIVAYYLFLLACALRFVERRIDRQDSTLDVSHRTPPVVRRRTPFLTASLALLFVSAIAWVQPFAQQRPLRVTILSVGAGSATVLELPEGQTVLYDAGSLGPYDVGRHTLVPFLRQRGIRRVDRVYISHANIDHYNALPELLDAMSVGPIYVNAYFEEHCRRGSLGRRLLSMLKKRGRELRTLDASVRVWDYGGVRFELLSPPGPTTDDGEVSRPALGSNDASTVMRVTYAGHSILLTGDIEEHTQSVLLEGADLRADVLLLPHHGSVCATTEAFIDATGARILIRSSRHRTSQTFNGLTELVGEASMLNTADVGAVTVEMGAAGVHIRSERSERRGVP